jgi:hypothetical protein
MASNFYRAKDAPKYRLGHGLEIGFVTMGLMTTATLAFNYHRINKERQEKIGRGEYFKFTPEELAAQGDRAITFKYML